MGDAVGGTGFEVGAGVFAFVGATVGALVFCAVGADVGEAVGFWGAAVGFGGGGGGGLNQFVPPPPNPFKPPCFNALFDLESPLLHPLLLGKKFPNPPKC